MRTRRFENTLREREAESGGARRCPLGSSAHVLPLCLRARVPAGPAGERPPPVGRALPGRGTARGAVAPRSAAQAGRAGRGQSASPGARVVALWRSGACVRRGAARGRGARGHLKRFK